MRVHDILWDILRKRSRRHMSEQLGFEDFKDCIRIGFEEAFPNSDIHIQEIYKNNVTLTGVSVLTGEDGISPTIYLEDYFEQMKVKNVSVSDMAEHVVDAYKALLEKKNIVIDVNANDFFNYDYVKDRILPRLVSIEANRSFLENKPYIKRADLAEIFVIQVAEIDGHYATAYVTDLHAKKLGLSAEVMHKLAVNNQEKYGSVKIQGILTVIRDMMLKDMDENDPFKELIMDEMMGDIETMNDNLVLMSNSFMIQGAACVVNDKYMEQLKDYMGTDELYIIPSSVHEVLIAKADSNLDVDELEEMIRSVNMEVSPEDRLSDNLYKYDFDRHELYLAKDELSRTNIQNSTITSNMHSAR